VTLGAGLYYLGNQTSGDSAVDANVLFNFAGAQTVTIDAQFNASILAPFAILSGNGQMAGNFIAAQIGQTGEVHNMEFTGTLPGDPGGQEQPCPGAGYAGAAGYRRDIAGRPAPAAGCCAYGTPLGEPSMTRVPLGSP
jgi:hypothetical protein